MINRKKDVNKNQGNRVLRERAPNPQQKKANNETDELPVKGGRGSDRHVDDIIRKYNDFSIIERD